ncbi:MAG: DCC1-like thiol-disulfide oxidoreductase family protein [Myxococcales bacterium]|nr:DCC1-like thiol-disulfide oxidoreductase family protein [Myxococcales bacterium]
MMSALRKHLTSIDPRTLGVVRMALGLLLLFDLGKRWGELELWYTDAGLLPGHATLFFGRSHQFSPLAGLKHAHEVAACFGLFGLCYLALLVGYRTRLSQVLSLVACLSLQTRADLLSNGGDYVLCILCWWTVFLPMGRRYSVDAVCESLRQRPEVSPEQLHGGWDAPRSATPVTSLAVLAALLQISVIYYFNTVQKDGLTWRSGEAIYYLLQQERLLDYGGLWARHHVSLMSTKVLSYATLVVEGLLPLLILSPLGKPWTRRIAVVFIWGLHLGIEVTGNFGIFSPSMMTFGLVLLTAADHDALERLARSQKGRLRRVYYDPGCGVCFQLSRLMTRLDLYGRLRPLPNTDHSALPTGFDPAQLEHTLLVVDPDSGRHWTRAAAVAQVVAALPAGWLLSWPIVLPGLRTLFDWFYDAFAARRAEVSVALGFAACGLPPQVASAALPLMAATGGGDAPLLQTLAKLRVVLREALVAYLLVAASAQLLLENWKLPKALRLERLPPLLAQTISYTRLQQGWSMFAADAPTDERSIVVDAITRDGRHVDPINELAARSADPLSRRVPVRPGYNVYWVDYIARIEGYKAYHRDLRRFILAYHERTGQPEDRIVSFEAHVVEQDSPRPGHGEPQNVRSHVFLRGRGAPVGNARR